jgi:hypothetical protein
MQDLLLAQQRNRPAYCFQHLDLELRSDHDGRRANLAAASARLAPWHNVVARFEPKWNSLGVNKTRSVNILGAIHGARLHSFAAFAAATPHRFPPPWARGGEVSVTADHGFCRQRLKNQQNRFQRGAAEAAQAAGR